MVQDLVIDGPTGTRATVGISWMRSKFGRGNAIVACWGSPTIDNDRATAFYDGYMERFGYIYEREL